MKKLKKILLAVLMGLFATVAVKAQTAIAGAGSSDCGNYVKLRRESPNSAELVVVWTQGFLSGINTENILQKKKTIDIPNFDTLALMLENNCISEPTLNIFIASLKIKKQIEK